MILLALFLFLLSSSLYLYLHKKTHMALRYLFIDNIVVVMLSLALISAFVRKPTWQYLSSMPSVVVLAFAFTMFRFWRTPKRTVRGTAKELVSPADGRVIYIRYLAANEVPVSIKGKTFSKLEELLRTDLLKFPCWLVGINMTLFDVHKNCSPIDGEVVLNQHHDGEYLSLKRAEAVVQNERNTYVIRNAKMQVGVVQIASKRVRRIDSYVEEGQSIRKGQWVGMIRFGSQVDVILPSSLRITVREGQQIYAAKTTIAELE